MFWFRTIPTEKKKKSEKLQPQIWDTIKSFISLLPFSHAISFNSDTSMNGKLLLLSLSCSYLWFFPTPFLNWILKICNLTLNPWKNRILWIRGCPFPDLIHLSTNFWMPPFWIWDPSVDLAVVDVINRMWCLYFVIRGESCVALWNLGMGEW